MALGNRSRMRLRALQAGRGRLLLQLLAQARFLRAEHTWWTTWQSVSMTMPTARWVAEASKVTDPVTARIGAAPCWWSTGSKRALRVVVGWATGLAVPKPCRRMAVASRPDMRKCYGKSPNSGKAVGERHRWPNGWGKGRCAFCGRTLDALLTTPARPDAAHLPLDAVVERCVEPRRLGAATPKPAHCAYPHCDCSAPRWCLDRVPTEEMPVVGRKSHA